MKKFILILLLCFPSVVLAKGGCGGGHGGGGPGPGPGPGSSASSPSPGVGHGSVGTSSSSSGPGNAWLKIENQVVKDGLGKPVKLGRF